MMRVLKRFFQLLLPLLLLACAGCALVLWLAGIQEERGDDMLSSMGFLGEVAGFSVRTQGEEDFPGEPGLEAEELKAQLAAAPGLIVQDDPANAIYPMAIQAADKDEVFVGRIRRDDTVENGLNLWCVADNIRKGAATNAVQIAEEIIRRNAEK